ncbi:MAG TPA: c-type cytochrome domain-containing protein [Pirellulales bacterium]|jgi:WD40 repeat protein
MPTLAWPCLIATFIVTTTTAPHVRADDAPATIPIADVKRDVPVDFAKDVQPLLQKHCVACHNTTTHEGGLSLESPQTILKGGDSGPGVVANKSVESLLLKRASGQLDDLMPPPGNKANATPMSSEELGLVKLWIDQGATGNNGAGESIAWQPLPPGVNPIYAVALTPDGQYTACGRANQIFVYHTPTGKLVGRLTDPELLRAGVYQKPGVADLDLVQSLAISPDGYTLASGGYRTIKLWSRPRNVRAFTLDAVAPESVAAITVSADGKWLATGGNDGQVKLWDATQGAAARTLSGHTAGITSLVFSADGARLFSGSLDKSVRCWQVADGAAQGGISVPAAVNAVAIMADGSQIAAGGADNLIRVWNIASATSQQVAEAAPVAAFSGHAQPITSLANVPGMPPRILSGSADGTARLWNLADGKVMQQLDHGSPVTAVAVRPDGARFATAGVGGIAKLWNAADGKLVADLRGDVRAQLQTASAERTVADRTRDLAHFTAAVATSEKASTSEAEGVTKAMEALTAAEKGRTEKTEAAKKAEEEKVAAEKASTEAVAAAKAADDAKSGADKVIADAEAAAKTTSEMAAQATAAADAAPGNRFLADAKAAGEKAIVEATAKIAASKEAKVAAEKAVVESPAKVKAAADALAAKVKAATDGDAARKQAETGFTAAEQALAASNVAAKRAAEAVPVAKATQAAGEAALKQSQAELEKAKQTAVASEQPIRTVAFSPDNVQLVTGGDDRLIHLWSADNGAAFETYSGHAAPVLAVAFAGDGRVVSGSADKSAIAWDLHPAWTWQRTIGGPESALLVDRVTALDFSPDGKLLASGSGEPSRSGELKIWNVADGTLAREIADAHSDTIFGLDFSPDGKYLASCGADKFVKVFDVAKGSLAKSFEGHTHHVLTVAWQSQGRVLASGGADNVIKVWNFETGEQQRTIGGFAKEVTAVAFVGTGDETISCTGDKLVHLYQTDSGKKVRDFGGASDFMYAAAITPDGKLLVAGGQDSTLRAWTAQDAKALYTLEAAKP